MYKKKKDMDIGASDVTHTKCMDTFYIILYAFILGIIFFSFAKGIF